MRGDFHAFHAVRTGAKFVRAGKPIEADSVFAEDSSFMASPSRSFVVYSSRLLFVNETLLGKGSFFDIEGSSNAHG